MNRTDNPRWPGQEQSPAPSDVAGETNMDLIDNIRELASRIQKTHHLVATEEATKNAFVMPFIQALGYDVFNPAEVTPELICDVGIKKGEKIDYAVRKGDQVIMLFECKHHSSNLDEVHASQLYRYFSVTDSRIGVLTNGIEYRFFSDLDSANRMDSKPFLCFRIDSFPESLIHEVKKFSKGSFDVESLLGSAVQLRYMRELKALFSAQMTDPSEEFVRYCAKGIGVPLLTQSLREQLTPITRRALSEFIAERASDRLKLALESSTEEEGAPVHPESSKGASQPTDQPADCKIMTTEEEKESFLVIRAILRQVVSPERVTLRDQQRYCGVLLDDSNRKPICRLHFNAKSRKYIGLFDAERKEEKVEIQSPTDIYHYVDRLHETVRRYL